MYKYCMFNESTKGEKMTKYTTKIQYVSWNNLVPNSLRKAEIKKTKLENQGYNLISTQPNLMVYEKPKKPSMTKKDWDKLSKILNYKIN